MMTTDHANIGLDTVFVQLCAILAEIVKQFFSIMAALICIKIILGPFC